jgi:hypothetical protein
MTKEKKQKEATIPNWTIFGTRSVAIEVHKFVGEGDDVYRPALTFMLDNGEDVDENDIVEKGQFVTIYVDGIYDSAEEAIIETAKSIMNLFENISNSVTVIEDDGSAGAFEYSLDQLFSADGGAESGPKVTFH